MDAAAKTEFLALVRAADEALVFDKEGRVVLDVGAESGELASCELFQKGFGADLPRLEEAFRAWLATL